MSLLTRTRDRLRQETKLLTAPERAYLAIKRGELNDQTGGTVCPPDRKSKAKRRRRHATRAARKANW